MVDEHFSMKTVVITFINFLETRAEFEEIKCTKKITRRKRVMNPRRPTSRRLGAENHEASQLQFKLTKLQHILGNGVLFHVYFDMMPAIKLRALKYIVSFFRWHRRICFIDQVRFIHQHIVINILVIIDVPL